MAEAKRFTCPSCGSRDVVVATTAVYFVYLRCSACWNVWSVEMSEFRSVVEHGGEREDDPKDK